jgi:hypothetical protein
MTTEARRETLSLLEEDVRAKVRAGANIPTGSEHAWRDIPDLIRRLVTAIPSNLRAHGQLILDLQQYSDMICAVAPTVIKAAYTRDMPLQTMRMHMIAIMETHKIPILQTNYWMIEVHWQRRLVEIFHGVRYDHETVAYPGICRSPCNDDVV